MSNEDAKKVGSIIRDYAMREDGDEAGAAQHRYKEERIDRAEQRAVRLVISPSTSRRTSTVLAWMAISMAETPRPLPSG